MSNFNHDLNAIGIKLAGVSSRRGNVDIEKTLVVAAKEMREDGRLMSLMFSWIDVHAEHVIVEKLRKLVRQENDNEITLAVSALAAYAVYNGQHKWKKLISPNYKKTHLILGSASISAIKLKGKTGWLAEYGILAAEGSIRIREADILTPEQLVKINPQYRNRLLFGATWRADIITAIENGARRQVKLLKQLAALMNQRTACAKNIYLRIAHNIINN